jgi:hypothetical protein
MSHGLHGLFTDGIRTKNYKKFDQKIIQNYFFRNKNTLRYKNHKKSIVNFYPKIIEYYNKLFKISMIMFCFCPNECNSLHWWAKQKEILYNNENNLRGNQHPAPLPAAYANWALV